MKKKQCFIRWFFKAFCFERTSVTDNLHNLCSEFLWIQIPQLLTFYNTYFIILFFSLCNIFMKSLKLICIHGAPFFSKYFVYISYKTGSFTYITVIQLSGSRSNTHAVLLCSSIDLCEISPLSHVQSLIIGHLLLSISSSLPYW